MPLYEYACRACGTAFERRRRYEERESEALCPDCGAEAKPVLSVPAVLARASAGAAPRCDTGPGCCGGGMCGTH